MNTTALKPAVCKHFSFAAEVDVNRLEDSGRFMADVRIKCKDCGTPFVFYGLPAGLDLNGSTVSVGGEEARLSIGPAGSVASPLGPGDVAGFSIDFNSPEIKPQ